jgi:putative FmdB family regulatory protein
MPIYEFYCPDCNTLLNFFSRKIDTTSRPSCPHCRRRKLERQVSAFAAVRKTSGGGEEGAEGDLPIDESKMESAVEALAGEAENINEEDPRAAAQLMRKFSNMTGVQFGKGMEEALNRMEAGEDPEKVEQEMGDLMEGEEPFVLPEGKGKAGGVKGGPRSAPKRDKTLYEM